MSAVRAQALALAGIRILDLGGIGPVPLALLMFAELGADITRVLRPGAPPDAMDGALQTLDAVSIDLKSEAGRERVLTMVSASDVVLEGFRPGVVDRLGIGPEACRKVNPAVVYAHMTGWGQTGPRSTTAGHDINYLAVTGALHAIGERDRSLPPLNLVGDYGGGSLFLVAGVNAALVHRERTGEGSVLDVAIVDGVRTLLTLADSLLDGGDWVDERQSNLLDGVAPFYRSYRCGDGREMAVGCLEHRFYDAFVSRLGLSPMTLPDRDDRRQWPELVRIFGDVFASRPQTHWEAVFDGTDCCVTPVRSLREARSDTQILARTREPRPTTRSRER